jgi:cytochrome P450
MPGQTWLQTLYYMTLYPQYLSTLREEADQVIGECGWTKDALDRLEKLDSFIRETQRLSPLAPGKDSVTHNGHRVLILITPVSTQRLAVEDFTFSNGVRIPKGTIIQGVATPVHLDPTIYDDPMTLNLSGFSATIRTCRRKTWRRSVWSISLLAMGEMPGVSCSLPIAPLNLY